MGFRVMRSLDAYTAIGFTREYPSGLVDFDTYPGLEVLY